MTKYNLIYAKIYIWNHLMMLYELNNQHNTLIQNYYQIPIDQTEYINCQSNNGSNFKELSLY